MSVYFPAVMNRDLYNYKQVWDKELDRVGRTWWCQKCRRFCPNCAGRSCVKCCIKQLEPRNHPFTRQELEHIPRAAGPTNPGSLFRKQGRNTFMLDPDWRHHVLDGTHKPTALRRPPWPWEQARYTPNTNLPITYVSPAQPLEDQIQEEEEEEVAPHNYGIEVPPLSYHLTQCYKSTQPQYVLRY